MGVAAMNPGLLCGGKKRSMLTLRRFVVLFSCSIVVACTGGDFSELRNRVNEIKARPPGRIDPIPEFKTYETFAYSASDLRDPFQMFEEEAEVVDVASKSPKTGPKPDKNRNRETLEEYPLDTLRYVGQLIRDDEKWAIITSPDALVHRVKAGNYLGQNYGKIIAISEETIDISELVPDGMGGWIERKAALSLGE